MGENGVTKCSTLADDPIQVAALVEPCAAIIVDEVFQKLIKRRLELVDLRCDSGRQRQR